jgi:hypothetical protein
VPSPKNRSSSSDFSEVSFHLPRILNGSNIITAKN